MVIVDLDGTLLTRNSFHIFTRFLLRKAVRRHSVANIIRIASLCSYRKLHAISHRRLKWELMRLADKLLTQADFDRLAESMLAYVNPRVADFVKGRQWILATAASAEYVAPLSQLLGCQTYISTKRPDSMRFEDYLEARGEEKLRLTKQRLNGADIDIALTDHIDDLPLLKAAKAPILVNPSHSTLHHPQIQLIGPEIWCTR